MNDSAVSRVGRVIACKIRSGCFRDFGIIKANSWSYPLMPVNFTLGV